MGYSTALRDGILRRVLPPERQSVTQVAAESGISAPALYKWMKAAEHGILGTAVASGSQCPPPSEKLTLVLEASALSDNTRGKWLRENGLHEEYLQLREQEIRDIVNDKQQNLQDEVKRLRKASTSPEKALLRKEKAIAEPATLVALKKKRRRFSSRRRTIIAYCCNQTGID